MDLLNKAKGAMSGGSSSGQQPAAGQPGAPAGGQKDYGDKAFDAGLNKSGYGGKVNEQNREKITDGARGLYEKATGGKVDQKYSN